MKIEIKEEKLKEMLDEIIVEHIKETLKHELRHWVWEEAHKLLAKEVFDKIIKEMLPKEKIAELLQEAFNKYVYERFSE